MRLKLTLQRSGGTDAADIVVTADTTVTAGKLAEVIAARDPKPSGQSAAHTTLRVDGPGPSRVLPIDRAIGDAGLQSGQTISLVSAGRDFADASEGTPVVATLMVDEGPDAGRRFPLRAGASEIGRGKDTDVTLTDSMVSKLHARVNVTDTVEIIDLGSSNGVLVGGQPTGRSVLRAEDRVTLGDTVLRVERHTGAAASEAAGAVAFNRGPYLDPQYPGQEFKVPEPPQPPGRQRFPIIPMLMPILMGALLFLITRQTASVVFVALSPLLMIGQAIETRIAGKKEFAKESEAFRVALADLDAQLTTAREEEVAGRLHEQPSTEDVVDAIHARGRLLWARRPDRHGFLSLRLGLGELGSRHEIELPGQNRTTPELWTEVLDLRARHATVQPVPVVGPLRELGTIGVAGARADAVGAMRGLLTQVVGLHSPAEVVLCAIASSAAASEWDWLKWLPHTSSDHTPLGGDHLACNPPACSALVSELTELIDQRTVGRGDEAAPLPAVVVLVEDDAPVERNRLVSIAERGRAAGVYVLWLAPTSDRLPAACGMFLEVDPSTHSVVVGRIEDGSAVAPVASPELDAANAKEIARLLAPVTDAGALADDDSDLPRSVSFVSHLGLEVMHTPDAVIERWQMSDSLPTTEPRRRRSQSLSAYVGQGAAAPLVLDLRLHGPHALVGGTTGAGKSELLQSWIMGLAMNQSPARVTFLFVDYKGGAAFSECVNLPHSIGLVTDLSPHLVRRALRSLDAELRYREHVLQRKKAKDLLELEKRGDPETPPSLVIVVDEFAALVQEVPEFVDGVVNVAQRGRSLGLHLILATQRPAGVIKDNLRANTNLRLALRMADEDDSNDVIGTKQAAAFDPSLPGRAVAKLGPGRLTPFQTAYLGGWTEERPPEPVITVETLVFGAGELWEDKTAPDEHQASAEELGPNDLHRLVASAAEAARVAGIEPPRKAWLAELPRTFDLAKLEQSRRDDELVFGIADDPDNQRQVPVAFFPDRDGNMAVYGTGGAGKSAFLRTLGIVAGLGVRGGPCHVYGLDFATRGLQVLESLPHVGSVINGDDDERVARLLRMLRETIDERAMRYAAAKAGTIAEYRQLADAPEEPRILVLLDGMSAFRQAYESGSRMALFELFQGLAADGRQVGVHVVVSADRYGAVPTALASSIQRDLVLRLANEMDYQMLNTPADALSAASPPGRGFVDGFEVQCAVLGGTANTAVQAAAIEKLSGEMRRTIRRAPAPPIERLGDRIPLDELPVLVDGRPTLGVADETLEPIGFSFEDPLLVMGPPQSGKSTVVAALVESLRRAGAVRRFVYVGAPNTVLLGLAPWDLAATTPEQVASVCESFPGEVERDPSIALVIDDIGSFLNTDADYPLSELLAGLRGSGVVVIAEGETSSVTGSWPLFQPLKVARHGIALAPDQIDGEMVFKTPFPRINRADFPPGRGFYVRHGNAVKVQCALPKGVV